MAFEIIVKEQIERLKAPTLKCVDLVILELTEVVRKCSEKVRSGRLQQNISMGYCKKDVTPVR